MSNEQIAIKDVVLKRMHFAATEAIPAGELKRLNDAKFFCRIDVKFGDLIAQMTDWVWGEDLETHSILYPATWWQGFKETYFPRWLKRRFHVLYTIEHFDVSVIYPDLHKKIIPGREHRLKVTRRTETQK